MTGPKIRVSLDESELEGLHEILTASNHSQATKLLAKIAAYRTKYAVGLIRPAYFTTTKSVEQAIGLDTTAPTTPPIHARAVAHNKYMQAPNLCTPEEIELAQTYRFENNLMTEQEELEFISTSGNLSHGSCHSNL